MSGGLGAWTGCCATPTWRSQPRGLASAGHHSVDDAARFLLRSGPGVAVVTLGADGAALHRAGSG